MAQTLRPCSDSRQICNVQGYGLTALVTGEAEATSTNGAPRLVRGTRGERRRKKKSYLACFPFENRGQLQEKVSPNIKRS